MLCDYTVTRHSSTGKSPATVLFNRPLRITLPEAQDQSTNPANICTADQHAKRKMKAYADNRAYVKPKSIYPGSVLLKRDKTYRKSETQYEPKPYTVVERKGSTITVGRGNKIVTRNSLHFKPITTAQRSDNVTDDDEYDSTEHPNEQPQQQEPQEPNLPHKNQTYHTLGVTRNVFADHQHICRLSVIISYC